MLDTEILYKAITKAAENGFPIISRDFSVAPNKLIVYNVMGRPIINEPATIIFSHQFAQAFFRTGENHHHGGFFQGAVGEEHPWTWHLQHMVLSDDPIKYLEKYL